MLFSLRWVKKTDTGALSRQFGLLPTCNNTFTVIILGQGPYLIWTKAKIIRLNKNLYFYVTSFPQAAILIFRHFIKRQLYI